MRRADRMPSFRLEDPVSSAILSSSKTAPQTPQTLTEKTVQRSVGLAPGKKVKAGDHVTLSPPGALATTTPGPALKFMPWRFQDLQQLSHWTMMYKTAGPGWYQKPEGQNKTPLIPRSRKLPKDETLTGILPRLPREVEGEIVFCDADSTNTDAIYFGKYTYRDNLSVETMAEVCMENYDNPSGTSRGPGTSWFVWDVRRGKVTVTEGEGGQTWSQKVGELPPNVQEIIACGGLEKWVKLEISSSA
ncbi:hypothetical protein DL771_006317 [Monosporascus sp. 5C6A]|nr:hypothetical protein DL771_006317 [Monosporascus sp. 5C6A]